MSTNKITKAVDALFKDLLGEMEKKKHKKVKRRISKILKEELSKTLKKKEKIYSKIQDETPEEATLENILDMPKIKDEVENSKTNPPLEMETKLDKIELPKSPSKKEEAPLKKKSPRPTRKDSLKS